MTNAAYLVGLLLLSATVRKIRTDFVVDEANLRSAILTDYVKEVRPSFPTNIQLSFHLTAISSLDIKNQLFSVAGWWSMHWKDSRLEWNQTDYNGIPVIQIFEDKIWTPTIVVDNSVNDLSAIDEDTIPLRVTSQGEVNWTPPGLLSVNCDMDITHFPFDTQICYLQITSFGYTIQELDIFTYEGGINMNYFSEDGEWNIDSTWATRSTYEEGIFEYARVNYYFKLTRKPLYYGLNMLLPVIVTAILTVFVFLLPADSGEKIGYCLTVMLAFMVILTLIAQGLPTTASNTSLLELYIAVVLVMGCLSVILSIYVLEIYHRPEDTPVTGFYRKFVTVGMRISCYDMPCARRVTPEGMRQESMKDTEDRYQPNGTADRNGNPNTKSSQYNNRGDNHAHTRQFSRKYSELNLRPITAESTQEDMTLGGEMTWQTVSIVLDAVLFRFYCLFLSVSSIVFITLLVAG